MQEGSYMLTYSVSDNAGNAADQVSRTVIVTPDVSAPELVLMGSNPYRLPVYDMYNEEGYSAIDQVDGDISAQVMISGTIDSATLGTYTLTYTITDASGNTVSVDREVEVFDSIAPLVVLNGVDSLFLEVYNPYTEDGYQANDNYDQNPLTSVSGVVNTNKLGTYLINYCAEDQSGNRTCAVRKVVVGDTTRPVLTLLGSNPDTVDRWQTYVDPGYSIDDNYDVLAFVELGGAPVPTWDAGEYVISYVAKDHSGNISDTLKRIVRVIENPLG